MSINSQAKERLGDLFYIFRVIILPANSQEREFLENISVRGRRRTDPNLIYELGKSHLRSSKLLACWNQLEGIRIETRNGSGSWLGGTW